MTDPDSLDRAHGIDGLARIGSALIHACAADPLLTQRLPCRAVDAIDLHDTDPIDRPVLGRVLSYQRSRA